MNGILPFFKVFVRRILSLLDDISLQIDIIVGQSIFFIFSVAIFFKNAV